MEHFPPFSDIKPMKICHLENSDWILEMIMRIQSFCVSMYEIIWNS